MNTKGHCYPKAIILQAVYFKLRFTLSYRDVEEIMKMRGIQVDHATIQLWVFKFSPMIESQMKKRKNRVEVSWRMDETYIKVKGIWCYLYRAVDKCGNTVDFLLTRRRQRMSAQSFLIKAIKNNCRPTVIWRIQNGLGFKSFESARRTLSGIEVVHMLRKNQMLNPGISMFKSFCKLAA